jgi:nucleobase:cation symporter-1, NCS1 family
MVKFPSGAELGARFRSAEAFKEFVKAPKNIDGHVAIGDPKWSNKDLEPTPPEQRTWQWYNLPLYWFSNMFGTTGWNVAAALIATGLVRNRYSLNQSNLSKTEDKVKVIVLIH